MRRHRKQAETKRSLSGFSVARGDYLRIRWNDGPFGSGVRGSIVATVGPKWITLIDPATLAMAKVEPRDLRHGHPRRVNLPRGQPARLIADRVAQYRRLGLPFAEKAVAETIRRLAA